MNKKLIPIVCFFLFLFSCKPDKNPVVPPTINPKQFTSQMDRLYSWKTTVRDHCLPCNPSYDSSYSGSQVSFSMEVINDTTVYIGTKEYTKLTEDDLFRYIKHDEKNKYTYFECPKGPYINQSLKYYYNESRVELLLRSDSAGFRGEDVLYISQ